jgi:hypothetical protein
LPEEAGGIAAMAIARRPQPFVARARRMPADGRFGLLSHLLPDCARDILDHFRRGVPPPAISCRSFG